MKWQDIVLALRVIAVVVGTVATALAALTADPTPLVGGVLALGGVVGLRE